MAESIRGDETIIDLLLDQHMEIKRLFTDVLSATGDDKVALFDDLANLLSAHEAAEQEIVHLNARDRINEGYRIVGERLDEEQEAKQALVQLRRLGVDHPEFDSRLRSLADIVIRHATAEETEEFGELQASLTEAELVRMAQDVRAAESRA